MKTLIIYLVLFHSVLMGNQDPIPTKYSVQEATLCRGDHMVLGNKEIKFKEIISDSRCPKRVTCIRAGDVKVLVAFYEEGKFLGEKIVTGGNISVGNQDIITEADISITEFFNGEEFKIKKVLVNPYPEAGYKIDKDEYSVELLVTEIVEK